MKEEEKSVNYVKVATMRARSRDHTRDFKGQRRRWGNNLGVRVGMEKV